MNAQVVCHVRAGVTLTFKLKEKDATIGRDPRIPISVPVEGVSRQHARIKWDGKSYWIEDLKSTNGTFLNGQAAVRERLKHLDVIGLGKELDLVFLLRATEAPSSRQGIVKASLVPEAEGALLVAIAAGEITLGRSPTTNVVVDSGAVSKVHARIERTLDQLVLEDLGSANGTYVNGARVMTAFLQDGDVVSLAGVETFRVEVEMGEVKGFGTSGKMRSPVAPLDRPRFSPDWKTRFDWDSGERQVLEDLRHQIREREKARESQRERTKKVDVVKAPGHPARPVGAAKPGAAAAAKPAAAAAKPPAPAAKPEAAAAKPAASAPQPPQAPPPKPAAAVTPAAPPKAPPAATAKPVEAAKPAPPRAAKPTAPTAPAPPVAAKPSIPASPPQATLPLASEPAATPSAAKPASAAPAAPPRPAPPVAPPAAAPAAAPTGIVALGPQPAPAAPAPVVAKPSRIVEVRLLGEGFDLSVREPGAHELGRATEAPLRVNHPTVSRKHARVILSDDRGIAYLQDAGGANGTRLNGKAIEKLAPLTDGDRVGIGEVELKVVLKRG